MTGVTHEGARFGDDELLAIARSVEPHDRERIAPPPQVWDNILAEVEVETASSEADARALARGRRRWFTSTRVLAVAAASVLFVGVIAALTTGTAGDESVELAAATLTDDGLPESTDATAAARFVCEGDRCTVEVDLSAVPEAGDADLELWIINSDVSDMHSLGVISDSGTFEVPAGATNDEFPIVDISIEPRDGDPTHSGRSVLRGVLEQG